MQQTKLPKMNQAQQRVYNYIVERIGDKSYSVGVRIPTENELAELLKTNRMNVHKALNHLETHGLLFRNKRGGTTVAKVPSLFTLGELKRKTARFVAVLNPLPPETAHIHWNQRTVKALKTGLKKNGLEMREYDVTQIDNPESMKELLTQLAQEGAVALLCISFDHLSRTLEENPELFFSYHRNIFVYARDLVHWSRFPYNVVSVDLFNEGVMAAEYTYMNGYDNVFWGSQEYIKNCSWFHARKSGFLCGLQRMSGGGMIMQKADPENDMESFLSSLSLGKKVMLAAATDIMAAMFIENIKSATGKLPGKDYGLISFNDDSRFKKYNLTTIAPPLDDICATLTELIANAVNGRNNHTSFIKVKSQLKRGLTG